jgi:hypothetical protein
MNENVHLTDELVVLDKTKVKDNNLIMNNTYFLDDKYKRPKTHNQKIAEFVYQMTVFRE